jgi:hypothetical protein
MSQLQNRGNLNADMSSAENVSVLDVFHLLQHFPQAYFANPDADHREIIRTLLKPVIKGNRFHVAKKQAIVEELIGEFAGSYRELMQVCTAIAAAYYENLESMESSIKSRAGFENELIPVLYRSRSLKEVYKKIAIYQKTGDATILPRRD